MRIPTLAPIAGKLYAFFDVRPQPAGELAGDAFTGKLSPPIFRIRIKSISAKSTQAIKPIKLVTGLPGKRITPLRIRLRKHLPQPGKRLPQPKTNPVRKTHIGIQKKNTAA
ncbi:hypothetical protein RQN30_08495 [Arcanobacterium hippocoleae]